VLAYLLRHRERVADALAATGDHAAVPGYCKALATASPGQAAGLRTRLARAAVLGRAGEGQVAIPGQEDHLITPVDGGRLVGGEDDRDPAAGQLPQQPHDLRRRRRIQARRGFIQEDGARPGEQLDRDAGTLALTTRQHPDRDVTPIGQVQLAQYVVDHPVGLPGRGARGQPESRRVLEHAPQRHLAVDDVILRDVADARVARSAGIDPDAVVPDLAGRGRPQPGENLEQGALPRSAAAGDGNQLTRLDGGHHGHPRDIGAATLGASLERSWRPRARRRVMRC